MESVEFGQNSVNITDDKKPDVVEQPSVDEQVADVEQPADEQSSVEQSSVEQSSVEQSSVGQSSVEQSSVEQSSRKIKLKEKLTLDNFEGTRTNIYQCEKCKRCFKSQKNFTKHLYHVKKDCRRLIEIKDFYRMKMEKLARMFDAYMKLEDEKDKTSSAKKIKKEASDLINCYEKLNEVDKEKHADDKELVIKIVEFLET